jgi:bifunctional non-homologous end joining protein LigD
VELLWLFSVRNRRRLASKRPTPEPELATSIDKVLALDGNDWDGLYLGRRKGKDLIYAGKVDHGFDKTSAADLRKRLTPLIRKTQPYTKKIAHKGIWVEPELLAEIESAQGKVRHPFFKGLREDLR